MALTQVPGTMMAAATVAQSNIATNVAGNGPAFRAYISAAQSIPATTFTKIQFQTKIFDTNTNYSTSTYRFTPTVAGYYQVNVTLYETLSGPGQLAVYKNGSVDQYGSYLTATGVAVTDLVYCNGSTDYLEAYYYGAALTTSQFGAGASQFSASMVRAA